MSLIESYSTCPYLSEDGAEHLAITLISDHYEQGQAIIPHLEADLISQMVESIERTIFPAIKKIPAGAQYHFDRQLIELDGTRKHIHLGCELLRALSVAFARMSAQSYHLPLYRYLGGISVSHAPVITAPIHEFSSSKEHVVFSSLPLGTPKIDQALSWQRALALVMKQKKSLLQHCRSVEECFEEIVTLIEKAGLRYGLDILLLGLHVPNDIGSDKGVRLWDETILKGKPFIQLRVCGENGRKISLIRPDHFATLTEMLEDAEKRKKDSFNTWICPRISCVGSDFYSDIAYAAKSQFFDLGFFDTPAFSIRYNRLLQIEKEEPFLLAHGGDVITDGFYKNLNKFEE